MAAGFAVGAGAAAVKWAGDFQAGMQTINTVALTTPEVLGKAGAGLRQIFRETGQSMTDLQSAEYDLVSAGVKLADAQTGVNTAVKLGIGALGSTSEAVDVLTTAINSYNLKAADGSIATATWARISDELAQAVADGKVKLSEIAATYAVVAPTAAQFGISTGEVAASLGYLTAKGNPAAETLTQMNRAIIELVKPKGDMASVLKKLGLTGEQLIAQHGLAGALEIIRQKAADMKIPFQDLFGRIEAYKFALQTTGPNAAGFAAELDRINHSAGMTGKQFDERAQGLNYQLGVLKANVMDAGITIGSALLPKLTELATKAADFLRGHQQDIADFAKNLAAGFEQAATWAEKLDWSGIAASVKSIAGFGKALAEGFLALPPEVKETLVGLFALNKLTGGAVLKIGVDLAGGLTSGIAKALGSSLAMAGLGKLFVQPVFVTNPGFGGGGLPNILPEAGAAAGGLTLGAIAIGLTAVTAFGAAVGLATKAIDDALGVTPGNLRDPNDPRQQHGTPVPPEVTAQALSDVRASERADWSKSIEAANLDYIHAIKDADLSLTSAIDANTAALHKSTAAPWLKGLEASWRKAGQTMHDKIAEAIKGLGGPHAGAAALFLGANLGSHGFGAGGLKQAEAVLAALKLMKQSPEVVKAIHEITAKLPRLRTDAKDLAAAEKIAQSSDPKNKKLDELNRILADLRAHGDRTTQKKVQDVITAVKHQKFTVVTPINIRIASTGGDAGRTVNRTVSKTGAWVWE